MANKSEATLLIKIKQVGSKTFKAVQTGLKGVGKAAAVAKGSIQLFAAGLTALGGVALKTVADFGEFQGVKKSFTALANSQGQNAKQMLAQMKELSAGTISNAELMKQANNAMLLGLPVDRLGDMMAIARSSAQATGQSMQQMFGDLVTGMGRGSKLVLDNLGITFKLTDAYDEYAKSIGKAVEKLSEQEKKQAFINKALSVGMENAKKSGATNMTMAESLQVVTAGLKNMSVFIGQAAAPAVQFFTEQIGQFFKDADNAANQSVLQDFFKNTAKVVTVVKSVFVTFGQLVGNEIATVSSAAANLFKMNFKKAMDSVVLGGELRQQIVVDNFKKTGEELEKLDNMYAQRNLENAVTHEQTKFAAMQAIKEEQKAALTAEQEAKLEAEILEQERELEMLNETELRKQQMKLEYMRQDIANFQGHEKEKELMRKKLAVAEAAFEQAKTKFQEDENKKREQNQRSTLMTIASMSRSNNKALAAIGKAAAITQIAIETPVAIAKALSAFPPPFNFVAAGAVGAAMAVQAAQVAGVQLAEGGIVQATNGGVPAIIGEGGRDEAVIPLPDDYNPDDGGGLGGNTIVFNGPILGDQAQARQFAIMIDEELYNLRKSNESIAFDEGLV